MCSPACQTLDSIKDHLGGLTVLGHKWTFASIKQYTGKVATVNYLLNCPLQMKEGQEQEQVICTPFQAQVNNFHVCVHYKQTPTNQVHSPCTCWSRTKPFRSQAQVIFALLGIKLTIQAMLINGVAHSALCAATHP